MKRVLVCIILAMALLTSCAAASEKYFAAGNVTTFWQLSVDGDGKKAYLLIAHADTGNGVVDSNRYTLLPVRATPGDGAFDAYRGSTPCKRRVYVRFHAHSVDLSVGDDRVTLGQQGRDQAEKAMRELEKRAHSFHGHSFERPSDVPLYLLCK